MRQSVRYGWIASALLIIQGQALAEGAPQQDPAVQLQHELHERERDQRLQQATPAIEFPAEVVGGVTTPEQIPETGTTFRIDHIELRGAERFPSSTWATILPAFTGKELGTRRINLLLARLNQAFIDHGWVTTRAYLGDQNLAGGTLVITVVPGIIEKITYNGTDLGADQWDLLGIRMAFPVQVGDLLRLPDLEQGVDQLNRLRRNRAELRILPGSELGGSVVAIENPAAAKAAYYSLGFDNQGSATSGTQRLRLGVEANNLTGLQEDLNLSYVGSRDTNAVLLSGSIPWGYNTLSLSYSYSEYQSLIGDVALMYGTSQNLTLDWNRIVSRSQSHKQAVDLSLTTRNSARDINDVSLQSQQLTVARLGTNALWRFASHNAYATYDLGYSRGLPWFGADVDDEHLPADAAHAQFGKFDLAVSLGLSLTPTINYRASASGQWTHQPLFSSEQIFIGGAGTVRGFSESAQAGDRGFYLRQELGYGGLPAWPDGAVRHELFTFVENGRVQLVADGQWRSLGSVGLGWRAAGRYGSLELALAKPVYWVSGMTNNKFRAHTALTFTF